MGDLDAEMLSEFIAEAGDALEEMDQLVEELRSDSPKPGAYDALFRHAHAIKGTASFVNLPLVTRIAHAVENLLDGLRYREIERTPERLGLIADTSETLHLALATLAGGDGEGEYEERVNTLADLIDEETNRRSRRSDEERVVSVRPAPEEPPADSEPPMSLSATLMMPDLVEKFCVESEEQLSSIELTLLSLEQSRASTEMLEEAFRNMHSLKGNCGIMGLPDMESVTHNMETTFSEWSQGKSTPHASQVTAILTVLDVLRRALQQLPEGAGRLSNRDQLIEALNVTSSQVPPPFVTNVPPPMEANSNGPAKKGSSAGVPMPEVATGGTDRVASSIRVDTRKLDELMNLVGELIIAETTVTHNPDLEGHEFENFQKAALNLNRITRQLQDVTMQARMVPIDTTFQKMIRLVRDVSSKQGKSVNLMMSGEETEVDKSVIETIGDPLIHLIRNGIDHGLEDAEGRASAEKSATGTLRLSASHQGGEVWISVADDGRGIDPEKVLQSAIKKGVADPEKTYTRDEILHMVFAPGFSTAAQVTDISGRGVGMDVVKKNIERVNGRIDVDTKLGEGTTFTLRIPLTLAIIEGMLVRVGGSYFTIPLLSIMESVKATAENLTVTSAGQELLKLRDQHYPITKLSDLSSTDSATQDVSHGILVLVESDGQQACVLVDEVVGQRQTVIKPLPDYLRNIRTLGGCSILHNGDISLILDIDALVRRSQKQAAA